MERLAYAITDHLLRRNVIQKEDYDIYVYGYAVFLEQMCQVIGFILLGIVTKNLLQTALFLGTFYLIRSAFGGYHAETSLVCMLVSYGGWGAVMILSRYMEAYAEVPLVLWIVLAADLCVFAILGPVAHANKPLTAVQKKRNKRNNGACKKRGAARRVFYKRGREVRIYLRRQRKRNGNKERV